MGPTSFKGFAVIKSVKKRARLALQAWKKWALKASWPVKRSSTAEERREKRKSNEDKKEKKRKRERM
jgi:hypothetical protein